MWKVQGEATIRIYQFLTKSLAKRDLSPRRIMKCQHGSNVPRVAATWTVEKNFSSPLLFHFRICSYLVFTLIFGNEKGIKIDNVFLLKRVVTSTLSKNRIFNDAKNVSVQISRFSQTFASELGHSQIILTQFVTAHLDWQ